MRRLGLLVVAGLALAGCGMSSHNMGTPPPTAQEKIKSAYQEFFSSKMGVPGKIQRLQNGARYELLVKSFYYNPLAKNVSATVSSVTLEGKDKAKVVYTVKLGGAGLPKQTGTAVFQNGTWKVGDASLCKLVSLQGSTPSACKS